MSPADLDHDGDITEDHHHQGEQPGESEEVEEVGELLVLVGQGDGVDALSVGVDDGVSLQAEHDGLRDRADCSHDPGYPQQDSSSVSGGAMRDGKQCSTEPDQDELLINCERY